MDGEMCPNCEKPVATHAMYPDGRCPVVRVPWPSQEVWDWYCGLPASATDEDEGRVRWG